MKPLKYLLVIFAINFMIYVPEISAQPLVQNIKGNVYDIQSRETLIGATVIILNSSPLQGASTNADGNFLISGVSLGRHSVQVNYVGYEPVIIPEVEVTSAREVVLQVGLRQTVTEMDELTITPGIVKSGALNTMATVSSRSFSVEETRRYAGGLDDPARLVSAFAGVAVGNVQNNAIIVRGNSPKGISWRVEGVEIPAPHHLAGGNVAGGGLVTLFSSQMLANSDFHTSAFPAEFGNALAGVFDMNLRTGNSDRYEHTFQAGTLGIDFASEGPLMRASNASYLFNYRYSTLGLLTDINVIPTDQQIRYQDLAFKFNIPTRKAGTFSFWGMGGMDAMRQPLETNPEAWDNDWDRVTFDWNVEMGATGLNHRIMTGRRTYISSTLAATGMRNRMDTMRQDDDLVPHPDLQAHDNTGRLTASAYISHTFSSRLTVQTGASVSRLQYNQDFSSTIDSAPETYRNLVNESGSAYTASFYTQSGWNLSPRLVLNSGIHGSYFGLSNAFTLDPRAALRWNVNPNHAISIGYGRHSQTEELKIYFVRQVSDGITATPNRSLKPARAHHFVIAYDWQISENMRLKAEPYLQLLHDAPGAANSSFSMINYKQDWAFSEVLENNNTGRNVGLDLTFERFLNRGYYFLITGSVFSSRYKADDGIWRNTRYDKGFVANALFGREFAFHNNRSVLGINTRLSVTGGERVSPVLEEESAERELVFFDETRAFENQLPASVYLDLSVIYRRNRARYSGVWALQVKNLLAQPMPEGYNYNYKTQSVTLDNTVVVIPSISYKIEF
ncbi:MAG: TonB-dependent receptor [Candidatus Cyclonatronum sp.]|uniref:TonB-dependent receptor n=1 Tax=Cyclonatronum sp. TaxID=3024185 RepID=UPI0025BED6AC|nr:TonB-dependent receptor [Cyclonatronum sp.]MCH8486897.1 TonB-dependent receptor [Cyclonatronum sp.]